MSGDHYRRRDGAHLTEADLAACVPIHPAELEELVWPIDLAEDWLLHASDQTLTDLGEFIHTVVGHNLQIGPAALIEQLGRASLTLHRLIRSRR